MVAEMAALAPEKDGALASSVSWTWGNRSSARSFDPLQHVFSQNTDGSFRVVGPAVTDTRSDGFSTGYVGGRAYGTLRISIFAGGDLTRDEKGRDYALFQEHGTKTMPANPFFYPVWRVRRRRVRSAMTRAMSRALRQA